MSNLRRDQAMINASFKKMLSLLENSLSNLEDVEKIHKNYVNREAEKYQKNEGESNLFIAQKLFDYIPDKNKKQISHMLNKEFKGLTFEDIISGNVEVKSFLEELEATINPNLESIKKLEKLIRELDKTLKETKDTEARKKIIASIRKTEGEAAELRNLVSLKKSLAILLKNDFFELLKSNLPSAQLGEEQRLQLIIDIFKEFRSQILKKAEPSAYENFVIDNLDFLFNLQSLKNIKDKRLIDGVVEEFGGRDNLNVDLKEETLMSQLAIPLIDVYYDINHFKDETVKKEMQFNISKRGESEFNNFSENQRNLNQLQMTLLPNVSTRGVEKLKPLAISEKQASTISTLQVDLNEYIKKRTSKLNTLRTFFGGVNRDHKIQLAKDLKEKLSNSRNINELHQILIDYLTADYNVIQDTGKTHQKGDFATIVLKALDSIDRDFSKSNKNPWNQAPASNKPLI